MCDEKKECDETKENFDFIRTIIRDDLSSGKHDGLVSRFPPEPNGYLHIGHAKSICFNFGVAKEFGGRCHLRFDDTNPAKEEMEYIESIQEDVRWLGFDWGEHLYFASDYFLQLYDWAVHLIKEGVAYVDDLSAEEIRAHRGTLTEAGKASPYRDRAVDENLDLFERMRQGEFPDGERVLRAKIDMASGNINLRDPVIYRIKHTSHPRTGDAWCIYPTYDFAHGQSDAIEHITHSLCTLEFEGHRPLYEWLLDHLPLPSKPRQIEFARLNINYTVLSKRLLLQLVKDGHVSGWDDPRMPTISGLRRRGYTAQSIRAFCDRIGMAKRHSTVDAVLLENSIRNDLNTSARRVFGVVNPIKVVIENYPEDQSEELDAAYYPDDPPLMGSRKVPFSREIYIEKEDFREDPPKKFFRLGPGREVRLRWAYFIRCESVVKDDNGEIIEIRCTYDPETKGGSAPDGRKVRGTIHWVSAAHALDAEVRLYDRLFSESDPGAGDADFLDSLNPDSLTVLPGCKVEPSLASAEPGERFQFERRGYFVVDTVDSKPGKLVFNRIVPLRDSWARMQKK